MQRLTRTKSIDQIMAGPSDAEHSVGGLKRVLKAKDLVALGIGAIIGAGIFATTGTAAAGGAEHLGAGPAVTVSYILVAIACGFCALSYAEFASLIPIAGSAYTYAYATLGELAAWIIGWDLILEYAVGNVAVAISWSGYFGSLMKLLGLHIPEWLLTPSGQKEVAQSVLDSAPQIGGHAFYFNLPAILVVLALTALLVRGVKESVTFNNLVVMIKLVVILFFIGMGVMYVNPDNWVPFAPNGFAGIQSAAALIFFAYIGFDAVSTAAEETENPGRNLPIGMIGSLVICTILYILVSAVLTGLVKYTELGTADPMATALYLLSQSPSMSAHDQQILRMATFVVAAGAVFSMTAVLLVFQMGQPRIFFSMARDGLLPKFFAQIHPRFQTPHVTTIVTGLLVAFSAGFLDISVVIELCNIGTLFAFVVVSASVMLLRYRDGRSLQKPGRPYQLSSILTIVAGVAAVVLGVFITDIRMRIALFSMAPCFVLAGYLFLKLGPASDRPFNTPFLPLVPMLGILSCLILMLGSPVVTWIRFFTWLAIGGVIYARYGIRHSTLNEREGSG